MRIKSILLGICFAIALPFAAHAVTVNIAPEGGLDPRPFIQGVVDPTGPGDVTPTDLGPGNDPLVQAQNPHAANLIFTDGEADNTSAGFLINLLAGGQLAMFAELIPTVPTFVTDLVLTVTNVTFGGSQTFFMTDSDGFPLGDANAVLSTGFNQSGSQLFLLFSFTGLSEGSTGGTVNFSVSAEVPAPAGLILMLSLLGGAGFWSWRTRVAA